MLSFLMSVMTAIQSAKKKFTERADKLKERQDSVRKKLNEGSDSSNKESPKGAGKKIDKGMNFRVRLLSLITAIVVFFETLPIFLSLITLGLILLCVVVLAIVVFAMIAALKTTPEQPVPDFSNVIDNTKTVTDYVGSGDIDWTDAELAANLSLLTPNQQNFYRLGILIKKSLTGAYGGSKYMNIASGSLDMNIIMMLGVSSTETSMEFYQNGRLDDITKVPSDIPWNDKGYGFLGLHHKLSYKSFISQSVRDSLAEQYKPQGNYTYDAQFAPWGVLMSARFMQGKLDVAMQGKNLTYKIIDEWGFKKGRDEVAATILQFLTQAQYHGAHFKDYPGYINFWCALYAMTSTKDDERSFSKWSLQYDPKKLATIDYTESDFRLAVMGAGGKNGLHLVPSATDLRSASSNTTILLNGQPIGKPLWAFVGEKTGNQKGFKVAWQYVQQLSSTGGSMSLNFHYGFNSYLQGSRIKEILASKIVKSFRATPGHGQATIDKVPSEQVIKTWMQTNSGQASYMKSLMATWGTAASLDPQKNSPANAMKYKDTQFNVPFVGQGSRWHESFGTLLWHWGGASYNASGCMVYSASYAASAIAQKLINPTEMGAIMIYSGSLTNEGIVTGKMPSTYKNMGFGSEFYPESKSSMTRIKEVLRNHGVVISRVHPGTFTTGENHFIVLNGIEEKGGTTYFHVYTSSSAEQSMEVYTEAQILANLHLQGIAVWKKGTTALEPDPSKNPKKKG